MSVNLQVLLSPTRTAAAFPLAELAVFVFLEVDVLVALGQRRQAVQGRFDAFHPAERGTVTVSVGFEGEDRATVVAGTTRGTSALVAGLGDRHDPERGPVTWFATDRIRVWAARPYHDKGIQKPMVHHAQTTTRATFRDFEELARWVEASAVHPGVRIDGIEWTLTEVTRAGAVADVRTRAVEEARRKATTYAEAIGLTQVRCIAIADPAMLGDHSRGHDHEQLAMVRGVAAEGAGSLTFTRTSRSRPPWTPASSPPERGGRRVRGCRGRPARARWPRRGP